MAGAIEEAGWGAGTTGATLRYDGIVQDQRARVLRALAEVVAERGLRGASTTRVARQAGVSRALVSEQFGNLDSCFEALLEDMLRRGATLMLAAFESERRWDDGVLAGLEALLAFLDSDPRCARACLLESMAALPSGFISRARLLGHLAQRIDSEAREQLPARRQPPPATGEALVAAVIGMLRKRLLANEAPPFMPMLSPLTEIVVAAYLGPRGAARATARAEARAGELLARGPSAPPRATVEVPSMLRHGSAHRLRACIRHLAANPGASNQQVAEGIGVAHGGQVSTMLARLNSAGLLVKQCGGAGRPNSWRLSPHGEAVAEALRPNE